MSSSKFRSLIGAHKEDVNVLTKDQPKVTLNRGPWRQFLQATKRNLESYIHSSFRGVFGVDEKVLAEKVHASAATVLHGLEDFLSTFEVHLAESESTDRRITSCTRLHAVLADEFQKLTTQIEATRTKQAKQRSAYVRAANEREILLRKLVARVQELEQSDEVLLDGISVDQLAKRADAAHFLDADYFTRSKDDHVQDLVDLKVAETELEFEATRRRLRKDRDEAWDASRRAQEEMRVSTELLGEKKQEVTKLQKEIELLRGMLDTQTQRAERAEDDMRHLRFAGSLVPSRRTSAMHGHVPAMSKVASKLGHVAEQRHSRLSSVGSHSPSQTPRAAGASPGFDFDEWNREWRYSKESSNISRNASKRLERSSKSTSGTLGLERSSKATFGDRLELPMLPGASGLSGSAQRTTTLTNSRSYGPTNASTRGGRERRFSLMGAPPQGVGGKRRASLAQGGFMLPQIGEASSEPKPGLMLAVAGVVAPRASKDGSVSPGESSRSPAASPRSTAPGTLAPPGPPGGTSVPGGAPAPTAADQLPPVVLRKVTVPADGAGVILELDEDRRIAVLTGAAVPELGALGVTSRTRVAGLATGEPPADQPLARGLQYLLSEGDVLTVEVPQESARPPTEPRVLLEHVGATVVASIDTSGPTALAERPSVLQADETAVEVALLAPLVQRLQDQVAAVSTRADAKLLEVVGALSDLCRVPATMAFAHLCLEDPKRAAEVAAVRDHAFELARQGEFELLRVTGTHLGERVERAQRRKWPVFCTRKGGGFGLSALAKEFLGVHPVAPAVPRCHSAEPRDRRHLVVSHSDEDLREQLRSSAGGFPLAQFTLS